MEPGFARGANQAKNGQAEGKIGRLGSLTGRIGFLAPEGADNRYHSPLLCGGAATDITVYAYEIATWLVNEPVRKTYAAANLDQTGVDLTDQVTVKFEHVLADLVTSFAAPMGNNMVIYGREGSIELPDPHYASKCFYYGTGWNAEGKNSQIRDAEGFTTRSKRRFAACAQRRRKVRLFRMRRQLPVRSCLIRFRRQRKSELSETTCRKRRYRF